MLNGGFSVARIYSSLFSKDRQKKNTTTKKPSDLSSFPEAVFIDMFTLLKIVIEGEKIDLS